VCPNGSCEAGESCTTCASDCGACPSPGPACGTTACDYSWCGTAYAGACPSTWNGSADGCDCGCQFADPDCGGLLCYGLTCDYNWCGTASYNVCPSAWNGTCDGCDCGCQFYDPDCGYNPGCGGF
jgi:hypothetical protein